MIIIIIIAIVIVVNNFIFVHHGFIDVFQLYYFVIYPAAFSYVKGNFIMKPSLFVQPLSLY